MSEKLIPFDLEVARQHPERVRRSDGAKYREIRFAGNWVCVEEIHNTGPYIVNNPANLLRLTAQVREERFRIIQCDNFFATVRSSTDQHSKCRTLPASALSIDQTTGEIVVRVEE